jgi:hypothetical protein
VSKEERRRRRKEEANEELKQAVADIEWLRENGTPCNWCEAQDFGERHYREHIEFVVDDTRTNSGANAFVEERYLRLERGDRNARLAALDKTTGGRNILREAFEIVHKKGAAHEV